MKTSHHLETGQEEGDIKDVSNEEKIKDLQNSVTIIGAQLQHIQSEWQATAAVTLEVRDLLQGLKNTSQENTSTPKRGFQEGSISEEEDEH